MKNPVANFFLVFPAVVFLMTTASASVGRAGTIQAPYQIGPWEGFRPAAVSFTFDDNVPEQYSIAVPMFHTNGFKITLFTVINEWFGSSWTWAMAQTAASYGDEIASHTVTHPDLTKVSATQLTNELANSQSAINSHITNESCVTIAYPDCTVPTEATVAQYYVAACGCAGFLNSSTPSDFYNINSYVLGSAGPYTTAASIESLANSATNSQSWCVYLIHSINVNDDYSPLSSSALQATVNYFRTNQSTFWVETFGNVVRYIKERNAASITETANTGTNITVQVTDSLDNSIFNYPISIRRPMPANWPAAAVTQNGQPINAQLITVNSTPYVMFDAVPNGGDVVLSETVLPFTLSNTVLIPPHNLRIRLNGQSNVTYTLDSSTDLLNRLPVRTNTLMGVFTDLTVDASSRPVQFYRARWAP